MKTPLRFLVLVAALLATALPLAADEGMWMPQQIPDLAPKLKEMGFKGDPAAFADLTGQPMGAIVSLGGCTASFVSPDGLIATNHHCVQGSLQFNSTPQKNLLVDGFLAKTREEELSNGPGSRVFVTVSVKEVTDEITGKIDPKLDDRKRFDLIERRVKERVAACEKGGLRCAVNPFFEGLQYFEIAQLEIQDVRLVYAPAAGIGNYGGETDNWRWPRHTGDLSFYRAYVGKDGKPASFSKENVPYKPTHFLRVQPAGVKEGDLVFVAGYPGRTQRHQTYAEVKDTTEWSFPRFVKSAEEQIAILEAIGKTDPELKIKAAGRVRGLNNALTNRRGQLEGLVKGGLLAKKEAKREGARGLDRGRPRAAEGVRRRAPRPRRAAGRGREDPRARRRRSPGSSCRSSMLNAAHSAHLLSVEKAKKSDMDREPEYQERNWTRIREGQERAQRTIDARIDRALLRWAMGPAAALPADQRIAGLDKLVGLTPGMAKADSDKAVAAYLDKLYAGTKMADKDFRLGLLDKTTAEIAATKDPMVDLALALDPLYQQNRELDEEAAGRRDAPPPALHAGPPRAVGRPRRAGRERHAARDLRHRQGQARAGRDPVDGLHDAQGHRAEGDRRGRVQRPGARARGHQGPARRASRPRTSCPRSATCRSTSCRRRHDRRQLRLADPQRQGRVRRPPLRRHLRHDRLGLPLRHGQHPLDPRGRAVHAVGDVGGGRRRATSSGRWGSSRLLQTFR